ncbi:MAG: hypothetical protein KDE47_21025, partial [Caldilineaceae bacterium]|nr:hypothetical protein [Caldilineaceae bacterium]
FLLAGRYTLLEQDALDTFLPLCEERDVAIVLGGGFNSGILATGAVPGASYNYTPAPDSVLEKVHRIESACQRYAVPIPAAALQFIFHFGTSGGGVTYSGHAHDAADGPDY